MDRSGQHQKYMLNTKNQEINNALKQLFTTIFNLNEEDTMRNAAHVQEIIQDFKAK